MSSRVPSVSLTSQGPTLSRLVYGCWRMHEDPQGNSPERILAKITTCLELGIDSFDHADIYGDYGNEERFGLALKLKPNLKDEIKIITKCGIQLPGPNRPGVSVKHYDTSTDYVVRSAENSLKKLNIQKIDLLLIHRPDPFSNPDEIASAFSKLKREGKVLSFGVSNYTTSQFELLQSRLDFPLATNQIELNPLRIEPFLDGTIDQAFAYRYKPMVWSPTAGGRIFQPKTENQIQLLKTLNEIGSEKQKSADQILYAWFLKHPVGLIPVLGTKDLERIRSAASSIDVALTREEWFRIWEAGAGRPVP
ncbi:aldo/keto reductase [Leptospira kmetyi]|uniref:aldo/keto reductase n=1 Tax=Leptospira kmetyi TaxID=408139 RepID=UPI001083CE3D|nr:aldo/keto reductase [Leptospira kmetyi]TGL71091.1 oxidoreductase [Leptospira kmetyi]